MSRPDIAFIADETDSADLNAVATQLALLGFSAVRVHPSSLSFDMSVDSVQVYVDSFPFNPRLVVGWLFEEWLAPGGVLLEMLLASGYRVLNQASTLTAGQNKALMSARLAKARIPHSQVFTSFSLDRTESWALEHANDDYVIKPGFVSCGGLTVCASGRGVSRIKAIELPSHHCTLQNLGQPVYVQKFVKTEVPGELRVWVFGDGTWVAVEKLPRKEDWIANTSRGATLARVDIDAETLDVSIRSARCIGAQLAGVDIVRTVNGPVVFEVNTCPTFLPAQDLLGDEVPAKFAAFLIKVLSEPNWQLT